MSDLSNHSAPQRPVSPPPQPPRADDPGSPNPASSPTAPARTDAPTSPVPPAIYLQLDRAERFPYSLREYAVRFAWEWVQKTLIRWSPRKAGRWRVFWLRRFGARIGANSNIRPTTTVMHPWLLEMGDYSVLSDGVTIYNLGPVTVGSHSVLSQDVYVCAGTHDYMESYLPLRRPPITIGDGVWVCAGAFLGPGVRVGDNCIVAARAVVTKDVPPAKIVGGNPARVIKDRPVPRRVGG